MEEAMEKVGVEENTASELDALKQENKRLVDELKTAVEKITGLEKAMADKDAAMEALKQSLEESAKKMAETEKTLAGAVAAYKDLAVQANPGLVAEMVKGDTIEEIKESVASARALVEKVKQEIRAENTLIRVPAGAPQRVAPDLSTLSPREKIMHGMDGG